MEQFLKRGILLTILTLIVFGVTNTAAQDSGSMSYGKRWIMWPESVRLVYLEGFTDGQRRTYVTVLPDLPKGEPEKLRLATFTLYPPDKLSGVMTSLYSDPVNANIHYDDMVHIAKAMLSGEHTDTMLQSAKARGSATPR